MRPSAYYAGLLLADCLIFFIPCSLMVVLAGVLGLDQFYSQRNNMLIVFAFYSPAFILMNYLIGFMFDKVENAFKYQVVVISALSGLPNLVPLPFPEDQQEPIKRFLAHVSPINAFNKLI